MTTHRPLSARRIASLVLTQFNPKRDYASQILETLLPQTKEKQRATDLVSGTIRNRQAIDALIERLADCPVERIPVKPLNIIRVGAYELFFCPATGEYAVVNEAVQLAKATAGKKQAGFVNAVLRELSRHIINRQILLSKANAKRTLPQNGAGGCEFDVDIFAEPKSAPAAYFRQAFSLPEWLVADWLTEFGVEQLRGICFACNRRPSIYVRVNTLKTTVPKLAEKFRQGNIDFEIVPDTPMIKVDSPQAVPEMPGFTEGLFSVQDITASQPVRTLQPKSGWKILDICAAPGTKTTQLAELTEDKAQIIATDISSQRLEMVRENVNRLGIGSVTPVPYDQLQQRAAEIGPFDCILLDVPCSNTGVLAKRIEVRYRITPKAIAYLTKIQMDLLQLAAAMLKASGKICYSTCSIQKQECGELIGKFLQTNSNFKLEFEQFTLPSAVKFDHDGGYSAIITKKFQSLIHNFSTKPTCPV